MRLAAAAWLRLPLRVLSELHNLTTVPARRMPAKKSAMKKPVVAKKAAPAKKTAVKKAAPAKKVAAKKTAPRSSKKAVAPKSPKKTASKKSSKKKKAKKSPAKKATPKKQATKRPSFSAGATRKARFGAAEQVFLNTTAVRQAGAGAWFDSTRPLRT